MQEKQKYVSTVEFLSVYGGKVRSGEKFVPDDDCVDQRAPVNDPMELYNQFVIPEDVMEELENEKIEDFDNDVYDYDDRTDLGVDIAEAADLDLEASKHHLQESVKKAEERQIEEAVE